MPNYLSKEDKDLVADLAAKVKEAAISKPKSKKGDVKSSRKDNQKNPRNKKQPKKNRGGGGQRKGRNNKKGARNQNLPVTTTRKPVLCDVEFVALFLKPKANEQLQDFLAKKGMATSSNLSKTPHGKFVVTLWFRPSQEQADCYPKPGTNVKIKVTGFAKHQLVQAVRVELFNNNNKRLPIENTIPHITTQVAPGIPPWYSNGLLEMSSITPCDDGPVLLTTLGKVRRKTPPTTWNQVAKNVTSPPALNQQLRTSATFNAGVHRPQKTTDDGSFYQKLLGGMAGSLQDIKPYGRTSGLVKQYTEQFYGTNPFPNPSDPAIVSLNTISNSKPAHLVEPPGQVRMIYPAGYGSNKSPKSPFEPNTNPFTFMQVDTSRDFICGNAGKVHKEIRARCKAITLEEFKKLLPARFLHGKDFQVWPKQQLISHIFARAGRVEILDYLVRDLKFDVNYQRRKDFCTMLHIAAFTQGTGGSEKSPNNSPDFAPKKDMVVKTLINLGADPLIKNAYGEIPLVSKKAGAEMRSIKIKEEFQQKVAEAAGENKKSGRYSARRSPRRGPSQAALAGQRKLQEFAEKMERERVRQLELQKRQKERLKVMIEQQILMSPELQTKVSPPPQVGPFKMSPVGPIGLEAYKEFDEFLSKFEEKHVKKSSNSEIKKDTKDSEEKPEKEKSSPEHATATRKRPDNRGVSWDEDNFDLFADKKSADNAINSICDLSKVDTPSIL